jgi:hypothetical protein
MQNNNIDANTSYRPLFAVVFVILLATVALQIRNGGLDSMLMMDHIMGLFFLIFAMFKLFDLSGFADGFQMYDIIAKKSRFYAYAYPFIELALGALYLSGQYMVICNLITLIIMAVSAIGVFLSMKRGYKFKCACLGTVLNIPLSTVSLVENIGMGAMAAYMLMHILH